MDHPDWNSAEPELKAARRAQAGRKTAQLCKQVERALSFALAERGEEALRDLLVREVLPAPNAGHLLVVLSRPADAAPPGEIERLLEAAAGWLRAQVAHAIHRKRAPLLSFRVSRE